MSSTPHHRRPVEIGPAGLGDLAALSAIAFRAKAHWGYPDEWLEEWRPQLTFSAADLESMDLFVARRAGDAVGLYGLQHNGEALALEHLWVEPACMGQGIGRRLLEHAVREARRRGFSELQIDADPNAEAFYLRLGAERIGSVPASIAGAPRELPRLRLDLSRQAG